MSLAPILPETGLVRVIYASRWGAGAREDLHHHTRAIVARSIQANRQIDVTGLLLVHGGWFVQVLEGPVAGVRDVFAKIAADPRHFDIHVLASGSAEERLFRDWNMGERRLTRAEDRCLLEALGLADRFSPDHLDADGALVLMRAVSHARAEAA